MKKRIPSIDILRGLVIVVMAIDHVRDMFAMTQQMPEDMEPLQFGWFFTRWITHFCAPVFVFLAGTSAYLYGKKVVEKKELARFLVTRGAWLILVEIILVNFGWTLSLPPMVGFVFVQVIWAIAWSMIVLAALIWLPNWLIFLFSGAMILFHNLLDGIAPETFGALAWLWKFLHVGMSWVPLSDSSNFGTMVIYPLIPWIGVMGIGYVFGTVLKWDFHARRKVISYAGWGTIAFFMLFRFFNLYGDPEPWAEGGNFIESSLNFLNTEKYPPSLLFLAMTLGPALLLLIPFEKTSNWFTRILNTFGKVPFFFYILHFPLLTILSLGWHKIMYGQAFTFFLTRQADIPADYSPRIWLVYLVWLIFLVPMYFLCRWYARYKSENDYWWLKYI